MWHCLILHICVVGAASTSVRWQEFVKKVKLSELTASHFQVAVEADRKTLIDSSTY